MKPRHLLLIASLAAFALSAFSAGGAFANDRYATPEPLKHSAQFSETWLSQLQPASVTKVPRQVVTPNAKPIRSAPTTAAPKKSVSARSSATKSKTPGINPIYLPQEVNYTKKHRAGTIIIDTKNKFLYLVGENGKARRYGVGVGKTGFSWKGTESVSRKAQWPSWYPPKTMIERERKKGRILPASMKGGINNPLGARALYLGDTLYRIHGTNAPSTIGKAVSSGCIRMRNQDVEELYELVPVGTKVVVL